VDTAWRATVDTRLAQVDGALTGLRTSMDGARWVIGIVAVVMIGGFSFLGLQLNRLEGRADRIEIAIAGIPTRLSDEFHREFNPRGTAGPAPSAADHCSSDAATE
jgi:hypothetical protein